MRVAQGVNVPGDVGDVGGVQMSSSAVAVLHDAEQARRQAVERYAWATTFGMDGDFANQVAGFEADQEQFQLVGVEVAVAAEQVERDAGLAAVRLDVVGNHQQHQLEQGGQLQSADDVVG
ncbi:hypothetical protein [Leptolyngbya sp. FACHB-261]|uniref:hypothetical protein n=1 Tax=Leptolyngbya sp. FACHB-261 TaxID=2692806 RepID=UPI00168269B1|nr:hypothetical protein [Leptolyngbya sp. FACHB-261]